MIKITANIAAERLSFSTMERFRIRPSLGCGWPCLQGREVGFTLIEMMVTIAMLLIVFAVVAPNIGEMRQNSRQRAVVNELVGVLQFARGEAIKTRSNVTVCRSSDGATCGGVVAGAWEFGWIVFRDANNNGVVDAGEAIINRHMSLSTGTTLRGNGNVTNRVTYNSRGYSLGFNGTLRVCDARGIPGSRTIVTAVSGRIRRGGPGTAVVCP